MDEPGYLAAQAEDDPGDGDPEEYEDPDNAPPRGMDDAQLAALIAGAREAAAGQAETAARLAAAGRTGVMAAARVGAQRPPGPGDARLRAEVPG